MYSSALSPLITATFLFSRSLIDFGKKELSLTTIVPCIVIYGNVKSNISSLSGVLPTIGKTSISPFFNAFFILFQLSTLYVYSIFITYRAAFNSSTEKPVGLFSSSNREYGG